MQALNRRIVNAPSRPRPVDPVPVGLVITELDVGGAERALVALATGLDRRRWSPTVISLGPPGDLVPVLQQAEIPTFCLDARRGRPVAAILRLVRALRRVRPPIVQSFLFHANVATRLAAPLAGWPWVVGGQRVAEREKSWHLALDRWTSRLATGSVCVSEGVRRFSIEAARLPADRLTVIPNGVDVRILDAAEPVRKESLGIPEGGRLLLFVGRLDRQKGVDVLLRAFEPLAREQPGCYLAIVGDGPEGPRLRGMAASSRTLADRVRWLGRRPDVPALLRTADLLVLPSRWEGMPNVVLEAMAAGRAVVATDVEGTRDLVRPGQTGWLVPPDDPSSLTAALGAALSDPPRLARFGAAGRRFVADHFAQEAVVSAYDRLWSAVLGYRD